MTTERDALAERLYLAWNLHGDWRDMTGAYRDDWLRVADAALATGDAATWEATADRIGTELVEVRERASRAEALLRRWLDRHKDGDDVDPEVRADTRAFLNLSAAPGPWVPKPTHIRLLSPCGGHDSGAVLPVIISDANGRAWIKQANGPFKVPVPDGEWESAEPSPPSLPATAAGGESLAEKAATFWEERCRQAERERGEWMNAALHTRLCRADLDVSTPDLYRREQSIAASALVEDVERFKRERDALERRPCPDLLAVNHGDSVTFHGRKVTFHVERLDAPPARPTTPGAERDGEGVGALRDAFVDALAASYASSPGPSPYIAARELLANKEATRV